LTWRLAIRGPVAAMIDPVLHVDSDQPMRAVFARPELAPTARSRRCSRFWLQLAIISAAIVSAEHLAGSAWAQARHGIAMHGEPLLPPDFKALRYVNPNATKGGRLVIGMIGTFDSLNPLIVKGLTLGKIREFVIEGLLARNYDEPFTLYGLL